MRIDVMYLSPGLDFTVDTTVTKIQVIYPGVPGAVLGEYISSAGPLRRYFEPQDHFTILEYGIKLPFCFTYAEGIPYFQFVWWQNPVEKIVEEIADPTGQLNHILPNVESKLDTYINYDPPDPTLRTSLALRQGIMELSMVGVPDDLHGETMQAYPWIKVRHNIELGI